MPCLILSQSLDRMSGVFELTDIESCFLFFFKKGMYGDIDFHINLIDECGIKVLSY